MCAANTLTTCSRALVNQGCLPLAARGRREPLFLFRLRQSVWGERQFSS